MRRVSTLLVSTSVLILAGSPAFAQGGAPVPVDPNATAQQNPAQPAQNADAPQNPASISQPDTGNSIVVTGLRRALQSARNIKRNSPQVIDAIVAEDIGKLPDITVSDTAARIPGIQVERSRGEAGRVLLRGFDNTYYTTTYDSREIFTAEARSVALQDFPSGAVAAIEAFKTSTANLVEPGIAGLVNVRSRRPFDFKGLEIDGSVWGLYPRQSRDLTPNGNILISDRWQAGDEGEIGALLNFSYTQLHYRDSIRRYHFFIADLAGGRSPDWPQLQYNEGDRKRPSLNGAIQWRPHPGLEFYVEGLWQGYRDDWTDRELDFPLWGAAGSDYSNVVIDQGRVISGTVTRSGACCSGDVNSFPDGFQGATKRRTDTYQFAVGGSYDAGPLRISADLARTSSTFKLFTESVDFLIPTHNYTINWYNGRPGGYGPTFNITGLDFTNPANYNYRGFYEARQRPHGDDWQGRLDFEWTPSGVSALSKIQWGVRYVDRDASDQFGDRYAFTGDLNIPISAVPLTYVLYPSGFRGDNHAPTPLTWLAPTFDSVWANMTQLRQFDVTLGRAADTNDPAINPTSRFNINEKSYAGYGQLNFKIGEGETFADGILGMRVVRTHEDIHGFAVTPATQTTPQVITPVDFRKSYTDWLPNANVNVHFGRDIVLRLAATKTRTRPTFQQLNPRLALVPPVIGCNPAVTHCVRSGSGGNPFLNPLKSTNLDASLEYYFSNTGYAAVGAFHRDMQGFIVNQIFTYPTPDPVTGLPIEITAPVNTNKALIDGVEAQVRTFFDFDGAPSWLRSFGIEANATYINARADIGSGTASSIHRLPIPDVSHWTFNLVGMYEHGPLSVRLAYNRRTAYPEGAIDPGGFQGHARPAPRLDLSSSYTLNENVTLFFDWTNMLNKPFKSDVRRLDLTNFTTLEAFPMVVRYEEEIFSAGVRFHFGRDAHRAPPPPPPVVALPPPPPPPPVVEQPAPPPPPPPAPERGD
jgi:iron complex outermembrane receptor protein